MLKLYQYQRKETKNEQTDKRKLNALRDECYKISCEHGFHDEQLSERHFLCLVITELSEAVEADRKDRHANVAGFENAAKVYPIQRCFEGYIKDTVEDELADAAIRILDLAGLNGDTFDGFIEAQEEDIGDIDNIDFFKERTFTESIYEVCDDIFTIGYDVALCDLFSIASVMGFDLMEHIKLKMQYNRTRERLHGKKY